MKNFKLLDTNDEPSLKNIKLTEANLWMEPTTKKEETDFWVSKFKKQKTPFVLMQFDTEMKNDKNEKMHRRVYGIFINMRQWELENV